MRITFRAMQRNPRTCEMDMADCIAMKSNAPVIYALASAANFIEKLTKFCSIVSSVNNC